MRVEVRGVSVETGSGRGWRRALVETRNGEEVLGALLSVHRLAKNLPVDRRTGTLPLMNARTQVSPSGDIAIPKDVPYRLAWGPGTPLELVETPGGLNLRAVPQTRVLPRKTLADLDALPLLGPRQPIEAISRMSDDDLRRLDP